MGEMLVGCVKKNGGFLNMDNLLTLVVRTPLEKSFSLDNTTIIPKKLYLTYEDFCEKVDTLDDDRVGKRKL